MGRWLQFVGQLQRWLPGVKWHRKVNCNRGGGATHLTLSGASLLRSACYWHTFGETDTCSLLFSHTQADSTEMFNFLSAKMPSNLLMKYNPAVTRKTKKRKCQSGGALMLLCPFELFKARPVVIVSKTSTTRMTIEQPYGQSSGPPVNKWDQ